MYMRFLNRVFIPAAFFNVKIGKFVGGNSRQSSHFRCLACWVGPFQVLFRCPRPLNRGVRLIKVSDLKQIREINFGTSAAVRLIRCPLITGFTVVDSSLCEWNFNSGFQSFVGFRIPWAVFRIPKPRIPDSTSKIFLDSGIRIPLHGVIYPLTRLLPLDTLPSPSSMGIYMKNIFAWILA